jgi:hypothetical protein
MLAMDLRHHLAVIVRFRAIVMIGFLLACTLSLFALFEVRTDGLQWRQEETWKSQSTVLVTQRGFPEGRVILPGSVPSGADVEAPEAGKQDGQDEQFADPQRFNGLAVVYSQLAQSDRVRGLMNPRPTRDQLVVAPIPAALHTTETLPLLALETTDVDPARARRLNESAVNAMTRFLEQEQARNRIAPKNRVLLQVLSPPGPATLLAGRSKTPAIAAFLLVMAAALALAYVLDNLRPRAPQSRRGVALEEVWAAPPAIVRERTDVERRAG